MSICVYAQERKTGMITEKSIQSVARYYLSVAEGILRRWGTESPENESLYQENLTAAKGISDLTPSLIYAIIDSGLLNDIIRGYAVKGAEIADLTPEQIEAVGFGVKSALDQISAEEMNRKGV